MRKAVFLDRDGVLNRVVLRDGKPHSPRHLGEFEILAGSREGLTSLKEAGFLIIVVTNQPDVTRGFQAIEVIERMHEELRLYLPLDDIRVCYHDDHHRCDCRKPRPGLLIQAAREWSISLSESFLIGDRWKDAEAGRRAGCQTLLLRQSYHENDSTAAHYYAGTLLEAVQWIMATSRCPTAAVKSP